MEKKFTYDKKKEDSFRRNETGLNMNGTAEPSVWRGSPVTLWQERGASCGEEELAGRQTPPPVGVQRFNRESSWD